MTITNKRPIGATCILRWKDSPEELTFEDYISFGEYNEDDEDDGLGVPDFTIFGYVDSLEILQETGFTNPDFDWVLVEIGALHYE